MNKAIDLSNVQDNMLDDPDFRERYREASSRSCKNMQRIADEALLDHQPDLLGELVLDEMKLHGFTQQDIQRCVDVILRSEHFAPA